MDVSYQSYKYYIATPPFDDFHSVHSQLIPYWKQYWNKLLRELGSTEGLCEDELYWQDRVTFITHEQNIVGIHFIASYPIDDFIQSEYAKRYLRMPVTMSSKANKNKPVNTLQYLSVDPAYNYRKTGINFASVIADLSILHHRELNAQQTISVIRKSSGLHNMARKFGFLEHYSSRKHGVEVSVMSSPMPKRHPNKSVTQVADYLWNNRIFLTESEVAA